MQYRQCDLTFYDKTNTLCFNENTKDVFLKPAVTNYLATQRHWLQTQHCHITTYSTANLLANIFHICQTDAFGLNKWMTLTYISKIQCKHTLKQAMLSKPQAFVIRKMCLSLTANHVLNIKYDVKGLPAVIYAIKSICFSTSYISP